jgi:hypothetical protein
MTTSAKASLYAVIEQLSELECQQVLEYVRHLPTTIPPNLKSLVDDPTFRIPSTGFAAFQVVQPIQGEGIPDSQLLQEERR